MAGRWYTGSHISHIVRRYGYGKPELGLYLHKGSRKNQREKTADKAVGRTRGGLNTKLHAIVDGLGNPVEFMLSAGNDHDSVHAVELLKKVKISGSNVLADRAYGAGLPLGTGRQLCDPATEQCFWALACRLVVIQRTAFG